MDATALETELESSSTSDGDAYEGDLGEFEETMKERAEELEREEAAMAQGFARMPYAD